MQQVVCFFEVQVRAALRCLVNIKESRGILKIALR